MVEVRVEAQVRAETGKQESKRLRESGWVPGVVYGKAEPVLSLKLSKQSFLQAIKGKPMESVVVDLMVEGLREPTKALVREIQVDPVSRALLHVDFQRISMTEKVTLSVPVVLAGIPEGVRASGGILEHLLREVEIRCLPSAIPETISADVTNLLIGHTIHVSDLLIPEVEILTDKDRAIATVVPPTAYEEPQPGVVPLAEEPTEPELIKKERKEEEEEGEAPAPKEKEVKEEKKKEAKEEKKEKVKDEKKEKAKG